MNTFDVAMISDDNYVMPTMVTIKSLFENINLDLYDKCIVHICTFGINEENKNRLLSLNQDKCMVDVMTVDVDEYNDRLNRINRQTHVTQVALLKFDFSILFPTLDRLLYLDGDIVVKGNITEIAKVDISNYYLAASYELWKKYTDNSNNEFYFNSGVLYLNLNKMRENNLSNKFWETKLQISAEKSVKYTMMDQDALNIVCAKSCLPLSIIFNYNCHFYSNRYLATINSVYNLNYKDIDQLLSDVIIVHYVGKHDKPWKYSNAKLVSQWEKYYLLCGMVLERLNRQEFKRSLKDRIGIMKRYVSNHGIRAMIKYALKR